MAISNLSGVPRVNWRDAHSIVQAGTRAKDPDLQQLAGHIQDTYSAIQVKPGLTAAKEYTTALSLLATKEAKANDFAYGTWAVDELKAAAGTALREAGVSDDDVDRALTYVLGNADGSGASGLNVRETLDFSNQSRS